MPSNVKGSPLYNPAKGLGPLQTWRHPEYLGNQVTLWAVLKVH